MRYLNENEMKKIEPLACFAD